MRGLWLLNHDTLRQFEVPILRRMGFEIYTPKIFPQTEDYSSGSVDFEGDAQLSIPPPALDVLNRHDFYGKTMPSAVEEVINTYFDFALCGQSPNLLRQMACHFSGNLFLRAFGREGAETYGDLFSFRLVRRLVRIQHRFFFAQLYSFTSEVEGKLYREKALTLPMGFSACFKAQENSWKGGNGKLLFVCPRLSSAYYQNIYTTFKQVFADVPHLIAGRQFHSSPDPAVLGTLPRDRYEALFQNSEAMFYHSQEPRHVHYHPLEAVFMGLPLIYMRGGTLSRLVDDRTFPGACASLEEAKEKVLCLVNKKDPSFLQDVLRTQRALVEHFKLERCEKVWRATFLPVQEKGIAEENKCKVRKDLFGLFLLNGKHIVRRAIRYMVRRWVG